MDILRLFAVGFVVPFFGLLCLWGLMGKLLSKRKFTAVFADYPAVVNVATYTLLAFTMNVHPFLALLVSWIAQGVFVVGLALVRVFKQAWVEVSQEVDKEMEEEKDDNDKNDGV